jgi:hypothetical protein
LVALLATAGAIALWAPSSAMTSSTIELGGACIVRAEPLDAASASPASQDRLLTVGDSTRLACQYRSTKGEYEAERFTGARTSSGRAPNGLVDSTASNNLVQTQPAPGSCHAIGAGLYSRPDPSCTPGALNPHVTQATIRRTICRAGWTSTVRPREKITEREKFASMAAYGDHRSASHYEYDHFVPLELGGATNDARNLWPEPGASPNPKDMVEDELNHAVCDRRMSLARAQRLIVANWVRLARHGIGVLPAPKPPPKPKPTPAPAAWCSARASWNDYYNDYDVYVRSNQPHQYAIVKGAGRTAGYYTNDSGYADVYFYASRSDTGKEIKVHVGAANCSTAL